MITHQMVALGREQDMDYAIREILPEDNAAVESVIRSCLVEFGADHAGTAWADPDLGRFFDVYEPDGRSYWVAVDDAGEVVGGVGIGEVEGAEGVCELQKMYCLPAVRGTGVAQRLMERALAFASERYDRCYLETLSNMVAAQRFYQRHGFVRINEPIGDTGHYSCDVLYIKDLRQPTDLADRHS